jgi:hypothetical protein
MPTVIVAGDKKAKGSLAVTVRNDGNAAFDGPVNVMVLLSNDAIADVGDVAVAQAAKKLKLKTGQEKALKFKVPLSTLPQGIFTLLGAATANDLTSSAIGPSLSIEAPVVRLVSAGTPPALKKPITAGKKVTLAVPLRNDGNFATTKMPATYTLTLSSDGTEAGGVYQTDTTARINLKPNQSRPQKVSFTVPASAALTAGTYTLIVKLNAELNDTNGQIVSSVPLSVV